MRNRITLLMLLLCVLAVPGFAEEGPAGDGWIEDLVGNLQFTGGRLVELAKATPADKFGWSPNDEVRTISQVYMHVVSANTLMPSGLGAAMPEGLEMPEDGPMALAKEWEAITDKDEVIARLEASFAYASEAIQGMENVGEAASMFGMEGTKRSFLLIIQGHAHEHLGQSIAYARSIGVVPPWSQPPPEAAEGEGDG